MKVCLFIDKVDDKGYKREIKNIKEQFKDIKPSYREYNYLMEEMLRERFDLMVVDYGGISTGIGNALNETYEREVRKYATEHPNCLVLFVSVMGSSFLVNEIEENEVNVKVSDNEAIRFHWDKWNKNGG